MCYFFKRYALFVEQRAPLQSGAWMLVAGFSDGVDAKDNRYRGDSYNVRTVSGK